MADERDGLTLFLNLFEDGLFSHILEEDRDEILKGLVRKDINKGEPLCSGSKDINTHTWVVASGELELYFDDTNVRHISFDNKQTSSEERIIRKVKDNEIIYSIFSIAELLMGSEKHFAPIKAKALEDSIVYCLSNYKLLELARKDSSFAYLLMQDTVSYAQKIKDLIYSVSGKGREVWKRKDSYVEDTEEPLSLPTFNWQGGSYDNRVNAFCSSTADSTGCTNDPSVAHPCSDKNDACDELMKVLKLKGQQRKNLLMQHIQVYNFAPDAEITKESPPSNDVCFVVEGSVNRISASGKVLQREDKSSLLGVFAAITGESHRYGIKAGSKGCTAAIMRREDINQMRREDFQIVAHFCDFKIRQLSPVVRLLDFAITTESIKSGNAIERDESSLLYVMMGRLRKKVDQHEEQSCVFTNQQRDFGRASMIGFREIVYHRTASQLLYAVRDTRVARIPSAVFEYFMEKYPKAFFDKQRQFLIDNASEESSSDLSTVACVMVSDDVPIDGFMKEFGDALLNDGKRFKIWHEKDFPKTDPASDINLRQATFKRVLNSLEDNDRIDIYLANFPSNDEYSRAVILQADIILVLGLFQNGYRNDDNHKILREKMTEYSADKVLLLLHKPNKAGAYDKPTDTWKWLREKRLYRVDDKNTDISDPRKHQISHFHVRCPAEMFGEPGGDGPHSSLNDFNSDDFPRLVRYLHGQSYGLVLGGGGARGCAHVGVIDKMTQAKVPIDMVGGTSMGAFVGAIYCLSTDVTQMGENAKSFSDGMDSLRRFTDLTLPYASFTSGRFFNNLLKRILGEIDFEDLWIPYFNITTDITESRKVVNTKGPLWQYVRASMSLAAILPPLCDPYNGNYLLDGGSVDNLPAREMKNLGCKRVIAIDVGGRSDADELEYGNSVSFWWLIFQRLNPRNSRTVPSIRTIVTKLACISGDEELKRVQNSHDYIYERPKRINGYGTLQYSKYMEIRRVGEEAGEEVVRKWREKTRMESIWRRNFGHLVFQKSNVFSD